MSIITPRGEPQSPVSGAQNTAQQPTQNRQPDTIVDAAKINESTPPKEEPISPKFAALAQKERQLRSQMKSLKAREDALKAQESAKSSGPDYRDTLRARAAQDPYGALEELGINHEQLTNLLLNPPSPVDHTVLKLQEEIKALRAATEKTSADMQTREQQQYEQAVNQIRNDVKLLVDANEAYETVKEMGAQDAVVNLIEETFKSEGRIMTADEAAQEVEDYLLDEAMRVAGMRKVQARLRPPEQVTQGAVEMPQGQRSPQAPQGLTNLNNQATSSPTPPLSEKDRKARAILAFNGQLNKT